MKRLVYGVGLASGDWHRPLAAGPLGSTVDVLFEGELAAAFSSFADPCLSPSTPRLLAYAQVIEQLHRRGPLLPMRYGCLLEGEAPIRDLLRVRHSDFLAALHQVDGCDEFGLRALFDEKAREATVSPSRGTSLSALSPARGAGARYLAERNKRYAEKDTRCEHAAEAAERFRAAFEGLFVRCEHEPAAETASMISLCFLVRRENQGRFQAAFNDLQHETAEKLLLTGPWPPYHFVTVRADKLRLCPDAPRTAAQIDFNSCSMRESKP